MIFNSVIAGKGGVEINAITASALPATVVDGQIVVITDTAAGNYLFSYDTPATAANGDIWIHTVDSGGYSFSIGGITITPGATMQFNGSIWEYRNAFVGINGTWTMFSAQSPFSSLTWEQIVAIANSGEDPSLFFAVGDKKDMEYDGSLLPIIIGGFNLNTITGTNKTAALALTAEKCLSTMQWNTNQSVSGGWNTSNLRTVGMPACLANFPATLTADNAIKTVDVRTACDGSANPMTTQDKLRPHSLTELSLTHSNTANSVEGVVYPYYSAGNRAKTNLSGTSVNYWTRTRYNSGASYAIMINQSGGAAQSYPNNNQSVHVCFDL